MSEQQESLTRVCEYRGLPPLEIGTECKVNKRKGIIVGGNSSSNLNVLFDGSNNVSNCHPYYKMEIFNKSGGTAYESEDMYT